MIAAVVVAGFGLSLGRFGEPATARLTYDPSKARQGGHIFAAETVRAEDDDAVRMSEALVVIKGGLMSPAAAAARAHGVPAVALTGARFESGALVVDEPVFGPVRQSASFRLALVETIRPRRVEEGEVVTIDAENGLLRLYPPERRDGELALAEALRAYDGLRDGQALLQWWQGRSGQPDAKELATRIVSELARRCLSGRARPEDAARIARAAQLGRWPIEAIEDQSRQALSRLADLRDALARAASTGAVERLAAETDALRSRFDRLAQALGAPAQAQAVDAAADETARSAKARRSRVPAGAPSWERAARAAGAELVEPRSIPSDVYDRFLEDSGLGKRIPDVADDASLPLAVKAQRIAALFAAAPGGKALERAAAQAFPAPGLYYVSGLDGERRGVAREKGAEAVKAVWADSWSCQALGRRKRQGRAPPEPEVAVAAEPKADVSGAAYSRDPVGGRPDRVVIEAAAGAGEAFDEYVMDRRGLRELIGPVLAGAARVLSPEQAAAVARLARAVDDELGQGARVEFSFSGGKLVALSARALPDPTASAAP